MATIVLQAAGAFLGGVLGPVGAAVGQAAGAMAGYLLDRHLIDGLRRIDGPRLQAMRPFTAEEGASIPRVHGTVRIGGSMIWATRFEEEATTSRQGAKGGPRVTAYSYHANAAFALCEGEIAGVRRIWADGRELDLDLVTVRVHRGGEDQPVDPLVAARQGADNAPAYRGVAYAVFERFPLGEYGNRLPQFQFEVMRPAGSLHKRLRAVAMIPGSTEYGLSPEPVTRVLVPGETEQVNRQVLHGPSDFSASLDELQALCPNLEDVALVVTWFGDDLRAGHCTVRPAVVHDDPQGLSHPWKVSGLERVAARTVSQAGGGAAYRGTPSDRSVVEAIGEIRARGLKVTLHPFMMMDVPQDNGLPDPHGAAEQPAYPWRGRITCDPAPAREGTADGTAAARDQVEHFLGAAQSGDFAMAVDTLAFSGEADDWGYRRLVLHQAHLAAAAGGVDGFLLGSELRGLTTLRDATGAFPFVEALCALADEVRAILGDATTITYGADWTEYFGHQPADGSGDVVFHLDPLWAHEAIDAVGIDNYMPLSDWRDGDHAGGNPDGFAGPCDRVGLRGQVAAGEGHDWYYQSLDHRLERLRTPITDGAYGKPWVFRYKDIRSWWANLHFDRLAGVEAATPTAWVPESKPIWFTELGCPAVDKGANQPNVFPDPKSSEDAFPHFSSCGRSDQAQSAFLEAHFEYWDALDDPDALDARNPVSSVYAARMLDTARIHAWAWDARPFPAFPLRRDLWSDAENWQLGHWLNGRLSAVSVADLIAAILADHGLEGDTMAVEGVVGGYVVGDPTTARAALEPVADLFGVAVSEPAGRLRFAMEGRTGVPALEPGAMVVEDDAPVIQRVRGADNELPDTAEIGFVDPFLDYQAATARVRHSGGTTGIARVLAFPGSLEAGSAEALLSDWLRRRWTGRETVAFALPPARLEVDAGAVVALAEAPDDEYLVERIEAGLVRRVAARRIRRIAATPWRAAPPQRLAVGPAVSGIPHALLIDLPMLPGAAAPEEQFRVAVHARPWRAHAVLASPESSGFTPVAAVAHPAIVGRLVGPLGSGFEGRLDHSTSVLVDLFSGALTSVSVLRMLNGAGRAAILSHSGAWEVLQFAEAEEVAAGRWSLSRLLRGQGGTGDAMLAGADIGTPFVLLDDRVPAAGLSGAEIGLALNWRVGPSGHPLSEDRFARFDDVVGGLRASLPLAPVHLRMRAIEGGDWLFTWVRRGRIDADEWMGEDIPLGEETEAYRIEAGPADGEPLRLANANAPQWTYPAGQMEEDFGAVPDAIALTVRQIGARTGPGLAARRVFELA